jgi:hypothetical protein
MMRRLILAAALIPTLAHAQAPAQPTPAQPQAAPAQFCISPSLAQTLAATLHQDAVLLALLDEAAQEPARQAKAIADAVAKQKAKDATPPKKE